MKDCTPEALGHRYRADIPLIITIMSPKHDHQENVFYTDLTGPFYEMCATYSCYGTLDVPQHQQDAQEDYDELKHLVPFISLANETMIEDENSDTDETTDAWMSNAVRLYNSIQQITSLLNTNASSYTYKDIILQASESLEDKNQSDQPHVSFMTEHEVAMFESSIASFMTSTASQIDTLRQSLEGTNSAMNLSEDIYTHRSGILSHLLCELKQIMKGFQLMQHMRHREELELYHDPLKCVYHQSHDEMDDLLDMSMDDGMEDNLEPDEEFLNELDRNEEEFQALFNVDDDREYQRIVEEPLPSIPMILTGGPSRNEENKRTQSETPNNTTDKRLPVQPPLMKQNDRSNKVQWKDQQTPKPTPVTTLPTETESYENQSAVLQQEQVFLAASVQNTKLDAAQKVESQMMQITSLLSQFSSLISEQQEEIQVIADATTKSRDNVKKGGEKLVQATEQRKKSRHYFAWVIFGLGLLLLFLNAVIA